MLYIGFFYLVVCGEIVLLFIICSFYIDEILFVKVIFRRVVSIIDFCKSMNIFLEKYLYIVKMYDFNVI